MAISLPAMAVQLPVSDNSVLEALALRSGQVVEARVAHSGQGGTAQIVIANQSIDISAALKLQEGALIRLLVQGSGPNTRLTVLPTPAQPSATPQTGVQMAPVPPSQQQAGSAQAQAAQSLAQRSPANTQQAPAPQSGAYRQASPASTAAAGATAAQARPTLVTAGGPDAARHANVPNPAPQSSPAAATGASVRATAPVQSGPATPLAPGTVLRLDGQVSDGQVRPVLVPETSTRLPQTGKPAGSAASAPLHAVSPSPLQQAVHQTVQGAVARQDSITTLFTTLAGLGAKLANLPKPVAQAGTDLLAARVPLDGRPLDGAALKQAFNRSGVLYESALLKSTGQAPPKGDIKANLLSLRGALQNWLGTEAEPKLPATNRPPPPTPGAPPRAERPGAPPQPLPPNTETGTRLLGQTEAALARTRLTQISSLPDGALRAGQVTSAPAELNIELPLMFGGELSVGQFQILRDGGHGADMDGDETWKMRFSIHFTQTGEVGATVSLRGGKTHVMLWAERDETAEALTGALGDLEAALDARGLAPGTLRCRTGHPPQAKKPVGAFMDNSS